MDQPRSLEEVLSPIDSVVVLTHSYLQAGFKFGARRLNLASDFGKGIERVFDVTIMDRGLWDRKFVPKQRKNSDEPVASQSVGQLHKIPFHRDKSSYRPSYHQHSEQTSLTYKHDFDIDFFSFLQWHDAVSFEQGNYFHVRGCNIAIYLLR